MSTQPDPQNDYDVSIIDGGPLYKVLKNTGLSHAAGTTGFLCLLFIVVTWIPMLVLSMLQNVALNPALKIPFLFDISEICRFLICAPLLILAEKVVEPWLGSVIRQFRQLVPADEIDAFHHNINLATRARELVIVEICLLLFALIRPHFDLAVAMMHEVSSWQIIGNTWSYAQTYGLYIAKPIMAWLLLRWMWKYCIWSWLLVRLSTLNLRLIPTHPDDTAGLGFIAVGQTKFSIIVMAFSVLALGAMADQILYQGSTLLSFRWLILTVVCISLVIFTVPLLAFTPKLIECKRRGLFAYGRLAQEYVDAFDKKWIENRESCKEEMLGHADVQSLADVENTYSIVQRMKLVIIDRGLLTSFALASVLPFAPLLLTVYRLDDLLDRLFKNIL